MPSGSVAIILHAHLPFVRHPEHDDFLEERWLFEAITESYLPLLRVIAGLDRDHVAARFAVSLSPTLLAMLDDDVLRSRYLRHLDRLIDLAEREEARTHGDRTFHPLARAHRAGFAAARHEYVDVWHRDLAAAFRSWQDAGRLELLTSAATHAVLPLLRPESTRRLQLDIAATEYRRHFGRPVRGLWLPECAYDPALDEDAVRAGFCYVVLERHGVIHSSPRPVFGGYAPIVSPAGLVAFARDGESARQVWSDATGYPGNPWYRDFHRDIGFDLDDALVRWFRPPGTPRIATGIKYHRVTGSGTQKAPYDPERGRAQAMADAAHFVEARRRQARLLATTMDQPPIIVCPYDAELFGHWWFEGPFWLDAVLRLLAQDDEITAVIPSEYLERHPVAQIATPSPSSWGEHGHQGVWLSPRTDWIYPPLHGAAERLRGLCRQFPSADQLTRRALTQALRELLLAQSSDWTFMMSRDTTATYATERVRTHLDRCAALCSAVEHGAVDPATLDRFERQDNVFPSLDYRQLA